MTIIPIYLATAGLKKAACLRHIEQRLQYKYPCENSRIELVMVDNDCNVIDHVSDAGFCGIDASRANNEGGLFIQMLSELVRDEVIPSILENKE